MISLIINSFRLIKIIIKGIKNDIEFRALLFFIIILLISSTVFYTKIEDWSVIDALYFSVMTMSTVGYGDLTPTTDMSKIFTMIYTFLSIGSFVAFTAKVIQIILKNHNKMKIKLQMKRKDKNRLKK